MQDRVLANPKVEIVWNSAIDEIVGETEPRKHVTGLKIRDTESDDVRQMPIDGVFIVQCTGLPASGTLTSLIDRLWEKGFATLMFAQAGRRVVPGGGFLSRLTGGNGAREFAVNNCLFVRDGHPLFDKYRDRANAHTHVVADEALVHDVFFAQPPGRRMYAADELVAATERALHE